MNKEQSTQINFHLWPRNKRTATWVIVLKYLAEQNPVTKSVYRDILESRMSRGVEK